MLLHQVTTLYGVHKMEKIIHNVETNEIEIVELTQKEINEVLIKQSQNELILAEKAQAEVDKAQAKAALLDRLGITEDEAKLLLA